MRTEKLFTENSPTFWNTQLTVRQWTLCVCVCVRCVYTCGGRLCWFVFRGWGRWKPVTACRRGNSRGGQALADAATHRSVWRQDCPMSLLIPPTSATRSDLTAHQSGWICDSCANKIVRGHRVQCLLLLLLFAIWVFLFFFFFFNNCVPALNVSHEQNFKKEKKKST